MEQLADDRNINTGLENELIRYGDRLRDLCRGTAMIWSSGITFRNACDIMVLYLSGLIPSSPTHGGPILGESDVISEYLQQCCRNGILTTASEPTQVAKNLFSGEVIEIKEASVEIWIKSKYKNKIVDILGNYNPDIEIEYRTYIKFSAEFGPSYIGEDDYTMNMYIVDNKGNELFEVLSKIVL